MMINSNANEIIVLDCEKDIDNIPAGMQLGILEGRGPIHEKGQPLNTGLQIHKQRKYCGKFTGIASSEVQLSSWEFLFMVRKKSEGWG